jgi:hypothetical protein
MVLATVKLALLERLAQRRLVPKIVTTKDIVLVELASVTHNTLAVTALFNNVPTPALALVPASTSLVYVMLDGLVMIAPSVHAPTIALHGEFATMPRVTVSLAIQELIALWVPVPTNVLGAESVSTGPASATLVSWVLIAP